MKIPPEHKDTLLALARDSVAHAVAGKPAPTIGQVEGVLAECRGCFVTLTNAGRLRGCIGTFQPASPLARTVAEMAVHACRDPRFKHNPITATELPQLFTEVSVLSPLEPIDDPMNIHIGAHGIYVTQGHRGGCFLPEVAVDQGWDAEQFLSQCCAGKAGLAADAWRDPSTTVLVFTSEKFGR